MSQKVLITGATGGLGLTLVKFFVDAGYKVTATGRKKEHMNRFESYGANFISADLCDKDVVEQLCQNQDIIVHAAALSSSWGDPEEFDKVNVGVTSHLIESAIQAGCEGFLFISSPSIYAAMYDQLNLTELDELPSKTLNDYAKTKLEAERIVIAANSVKFRTVSIRPRGIVGPDDNVLLPKITQMIRKGTLPLIRKGCALIELTDVRDVAKAVVLAVQNINVIGGQVINISGGKPIEIGKVIIRVANALEQKVRFIFIPTFLARILAEILEWYGRRNGYKKEPALTRYIFATMSYSQVFNLKKAREKLGYHPSYNGLNSLIDAIKTRGLK